MIRRLLGRDGVLMSLTLSSGVIDAVSFVTFGKVFTAFMTGNIVFLGIGASHAFKHGGPNMLRVVVAIIAFAVGVFVAARILKRSSRSLGKRESFAVVLGGVLVAELVFMVSWITVSGDPSGSFATSLAGVDALAMGMQSCAVGSLELKGIFTTAVTATLVNLSRGAADRRASTTQAAQLVRILVSLVIGAFLGGLLLVNAPTLAPVIPPIATAVAIAGSLNHRRAVRRGASESDLATIDGNRAAPVAPVDPALGLGEAA